MKTPIKPFLVEVKRSRSSSSPANPVRLEPPVLADVTVPAPAPAVSSARQLAEQAFKALVSGTTDKVVKVATVESVFRTAIVPERAQVISPPPIPPPAIIHREVDSQASITKDIVAPTPRKPRGRKPSAGKETPASGSETPVSRRASAKPAPSVVLPGTRGQQSPSRAEKLLQPAEITAAGVVAEDNSRLPDLQGSIAGLGWPPGERWKRRLRHLR